MAHRVSFAVPKKPKTPTILSSVKIMRDALMYHWRLGSCGAGSPVKPRYTLWPKHWSSVQAAFEFFQDLKGFPDLQWHIIKYSNTYILVKSYQSIHCRNVSMINKYVIQKHMRKHVHVYTTGSKIGIINIFVHVFEGTADQGYIYVIKNAVKTVLLWNNVTI